MADATILCVNVGTKYPMECVAILRDMVARNLPGGTYTFKCVTDRPGELPPGVEALPHNDRLPASWWQKLKLFDPALGLDGRCVYFDLDVAITGRLDKLIETPGIIADWHYPSYNSSVMVWDAGDHAEAFTRFTPGDIEKPADWPHIWTDQDWLYRLGGWETFPPGWCVSYRSHATKWPPKDAAVVCFHGEPKPQDVKDGWVPKIWCIGGLREVRFDNAINVTDTVVERNIRINSQRDLPWFLGAADTPLQMVIVGGAPSLASSIEAIRLRQKRGAHVMATNGAAAFLRQHGITPTVHVILDARPENAAFVEGASKDTFHLIASCCDPAVFDRLIEQGCPVGLWHAVMNWGTPAFIESVRPGKKYSPVGGGSTVMLRSMILATMSGFRDLHVYGMDGCFIDEKHHAYAQSMNDADQGGTAMYNGRSYRVAPWMAKQAQDFLDFQHRAMVEAGTRITIHGAGLMPDICRHLNLTAKRRAAA